MQDEHSHNPRPSKRFLRLRYRDGHLVVDTRGDDAEPLTSRAQTSNAAEEPFQTNFKQIGSFAKLDSIFVANAFSPSFASAAFICRFMSAYMRAHIVSVKRGCFGSGLGTSMP